MGIIPQGEREVYCRIVISVFLIIFFMPLQQIHPAA